MKGTSAPHDVSASLCWNCQAEISGIHFCDYCVKLQPPPDVDYFRFIGVEPKLNIDLSSLEKRFYEMSRNFHPDFYQNKSDNERKLSLENASRLNDAYRTLKNPFLRAAYVINLEEKSIKDLASSPPLDLFEEIFELQELLAEIRNHKDEAEGKRRAELKAELQDAKKRLEASRNDLEDQLIQTFVEWDQLLERNRSIAAKEVTAGKHEFTERMKEILSNRSYLNTIIRDINQELNN